MSIRRRLNENPRTVAIVVGALVVIAVLVAIMSSGSPEDSAGAAARADAKEFFSTDDGKSWFPADATKVPPFDHQGKPAYRARVYRCAHGKEFVAHLERYADADRAKLQELLDDASADDPPIEAVRLQEEIEVKKPGAGPWLKRTPPNATKVRAILTPVCPEGTADGLQRVIP